MADGNISYQATTLPENVMNSLVRDDTPDLFDTSFWEFMGADIQNANIMTWDFENILDMVDISFLKFLQKWPENEMDKVVVLKFEERIQPDGTIKKEIVAAYCISELWAKFSSKNYFKMCRSREGFQIRQMTETKGSVRNEQFYSGTNPMAVMPDVRQLGQQPVSKKWGVF